MTPKYKIAEKILREYARLHNNVRITEYSKKRELEKRYPNWVAPIWMCRVHLRWGVTRASLHSVRCFPKGRIKFGMHTVYVEQFETFLKTIE